MYRYAITAPRAPFGNSVAHASIGDSAVINAEIADHCKTPKTL